jgi:hypothetical protein
MLNETPEENRMSFKSKRFSLLSTALVRIISLLLFHPTMSLVAENSGEEDYEWERLKS